MIFHFSGLRDLFLYHIFFKVSYFLFPGLRDLSWYHIFCKKKQYFSIYLFFVHSNFSLKNIIYFFLVYEIFLDFKTWALTTSHLFLKYCFCMAIKGSNRRVVWLVWRSILKTTFIFRPNYYKQRRKYQSKQILECLLSISFHWWPCPLKFITWYKRYMFGLQFRSIHMTAHNEAFYIRSIPSFY